MEVGVDGCKQGWFAVWRENQEDSQLQTAIYPTISELWRAHRKASRILIDIPIGLMSTEPRKLESLVRGLLGPRRSSVFPVPSSAAAYAADYKTANQLNRRDFGKGLSKQAFNICAKICEVDQLLKHHHEAKRIVGECHPELAFAIYNDGPLDDNKKSQEGIQQRIRILEDQIPTFSQQLEHWLSLYPRRQLQIDDCLDATVLLETAKRCRSLIDQSETGVFGIDVRMWVPDIPCSII